MLTDLPKRILLGRAMRSDTLSEQLLPKRIALPVFASDAMSSVAYATQEILIVLSLGGLAYFTLAPWAGLAVIVVMVTVVAAYRQNVHAYPSGGGDYEVATVNLGRNFGVVVAAALLVDYVLTVAVSVSAGVANLASTPLLQVLGRASGAVDTRDRRDRCAAQPARLARERHGLRHPDVRLHPRHRRHDRGRRIPVVDRDGAGGRIERRTRSNRSWTSSALSASSSSGSARSLPVAQR